jgi:MraZ protein
MFLSNFENNIDGKGRIVIPSKFREFISEKLYMIKGYDGCLSIYCEKEFNTFVENLNKLPYEKATVRSYKRILLSSVVELGVDKQFRMLIPTKTLKEYGISNKAIIIGQFDHFEIWDLEKWNEYKSAHESSFELDAEGVLAFDEK